MRARYAREGLFLPQLYDRQSVLQRHMIRAFF